MKIRRTQKKQENLQYTKPSVLQLFLWFWDWQFDSAFWSFN